MLEVFNLRLKVVEGVLKSLFPSSRIWLYENLKMCAYYSVPLKKSTAWFSITLFQQLVLHPKEFILLKLLKKNHLQRFSVVEWPVGIFWTQDPNSKRPKLIFYSDRTCGGQLLLKGKVIISLCIKRRVPASNPYVLKTLLDKYWQ